MIGCFFTPVPDATLCNIDATNKCIAPGTCLSGLCNSSAVSCDDHNPCTDDTCLPTLGCQHVNNADYCNDGNPCTINDICSGGKCAGSFICNSCFGAPEGYPCYLQDLCIAATCINQTCVASGSVVCNDSNPCTQDSCNNSTGCVFTLIEQCKQSHLPQGSAK